MNYEQSALIDFAFSFIDGNQEQYLTNHKNVFSDENFKKTGSPFIEFLQQQVLSDETVFNKFYTEIDEWNIGDFDYGTYPGLIDDLKLKLFDVMLQIKIEQIFSVKLKEQYVALKELLDEANQIILNKILSINPQENYEKVSLLKSICVSEDKLAVIDKEIGFQTLSSISRLMDERLMSEKPILPEDISNVAKEIRQFQKTGLKPLEKYQEEKGWLGRLRQFIGDGLKRIIGKSYSSGVFSIPATLFHIEKDIVDKANQAQAVASQFASVRR